MHTCRCSGRICASACGCFGGHRGSPSRHPDAGARHWREHGDLQSRQHRVLSPAAARRTGPGSAAARLFRSPDGHQRTFGMHSQNVDALQRDGDVFESLVSLSGQNLTLVGHDSAERVQVVYRTAGWAPTMTVRPAVGRDFSAEEERRGVDSGVAIISYALWQRRFGGARSALGRPSNWRIAPSPSSAFFRPGSAFRTRPKSGSPSSSMPPIARATLRCSGAFATG